jgi:hypothetical protein
MALRNRRLIRVFAGLNPHRDAVKHAVDDLIEARTKRHGQADGVIGANVVHARGLD